MTHMTMTNIKAPSSQNDRAESLTPKRQDHPAPTNAGVQAAGAPAPYRRPLFRS